MANIGGGLTRGYRVTRGFARSAVNAVDLSAVETLEALNDRLGDTGVTLHLSKVKGPVMDRLRRSQLLDHLTGKVFRSQWDAVEAPTPSVCVDRDAAAH